jgi:hypothetical protein
MCDNQLSFYTLGPLYMCVYYTTLRARRASPLQGYWLLSPFTWPTLTSNLFFKSSGRNWAPELVTTGCLSVLLRLWQPWCTYINSLNWTNFAWHSRLITISVKNHCGYLTGPLQPSSYGPYGPYRVSVPVQGCTLPYLTSATLASCLVHSLHHRTHQLWNAY